MRRLSGRSAESQASFPFLTSPCRRAAERPLSLESQEDVWRVGRGLSVVPELSCENILVSFTAVAVGIKQISNSMEENGRHARG